MLAKIILLIPLPMVWLGALPLLVPGWILSWIFNLVRVPVPIDIFSSSVSPILWDPLSALYVTLVIGGLIIAIVEALSVPQELDRQE